MGRSSRIGQARASFQSHITLAETYYKADAIQQVLKLLAA